MFKKVFLVIDGLPAQDGRRADGVFGAVEHLKGHTQRLEDLAIEMLARGLSVRDIEDAFKDEDGRLLLSRTAGSQLGARSAPGDLGPRSPASSRRLRFVFRGRPVSVACSIGGAT